MGYVRVKGKVSSITDKSRCVEIEFITDTGAMLTVVPAPVLKKLAIEPRSKERFKLATGEMRELPLGNAQIEIEGRERFIDVVFGSEEAPALLGVTTLETLGFELDPTTGKLKPIEFMLL